MAQAKDLISMGMPAELAKRVGFDVISVTTTGAVQSAGAVLKGPGNKIVLATITSASDAITLPSNADIGDMIFIINIGNNAVVYPQSGGTINAGTANQKLTFNSGLSVIFFKVTATNWKAILGGTMTVS